MKTLFIAVVAGLIAFPTFSQNSELDAKWANMLVETERSMLFEQAMGLQGAEKASFDVLFKQYESELEEIRTNYMADLNKYVEMYLTLTDEQANELMSSSFKRQATRLKLQKKYHKLISKAVNGMAAARFVQLDNAITMSYRLSVMDAIPFVGDM